MKTLTVLIIAFSFNAAFAATFKLPATEINFQLNRDGEVTEPVVHIECSRECTILEAADCFLSSNNHTCDDFMVNGLNIVGYSARLQLPKTSKNSFSLGAQNIEYRQRENARICVRVETRIFASELENPLDSQSITSFCTNKTSSWETRPNDIQYAVWNNRRTQTFEEFMSVLQRPIDVRLK